jgi:hypothetical protein
MKYKFHSNTDQIFISTYKLFEAEMIGVHMVTGIHITYP